MIRFSIRNPVVVNLLAISVFVVGAYSFVQLPREVFPEVSLNWVYVITNWPGSNPEEMERLVTIPLEEEVSSVDRIESISSRSYEGVSVLSLKFESMPRDEFRSLLQDVRTEVDRVTELPESAEEPIIFNFTADDFIPMLNVVVSSEVAGEARLIEIARDLKSEIKLIEGIKDVNITGDRDNQLWVEINPDRLNAIGVSLAQVVDAVAAKNVGIPVGSVDLGRSEYLIRMIDQFRGAQDVRDVVIGGDALSGYIRLGDVARVSRNLERSRTKFNFNGTPAISLVVTKNSGASTLTVIDRVKALGSSFASGLPPSEQVEISYTGDTSRLINSVLNVLEKNALIGLALVILTLFFFLGFRNAFFAALGIPITFMVTFIFLYATGNSFNSNSLFGLVLVLGVVVDDAIIVIENCYRHMQNGMSPIKAAYHGTTEVVTPVLAATATTVAGFLPLMLMPGIVGQFLRIVPIVVSLALLASLLEAFLVLPSHITEWSGKVKKRRHDTSWRRRLFSKLNRIYVPLVSKAIRWRYIVVSAFLLALLSVWPLLGMLGVEMFRDEEFPSFVVQLRMPPSVNLEETERILAQMELALEEVPQQDILGYSASAGFMMTQTEWYFKPNVGQISIDLKDIDQRTISNDSLIAEMREAFSDIAGPVSIEFMKIESGPPTGSPLEVKIKGKYLEDLEALATGLKKRLEKTEGLFDVRHDLEPGKPELRYAVNMATAARLGVNPAIVARELVIAFEGVEATSYRDGDEEIKVIVKYDEALGGNLAALDQMRLSTPDGRTIALSDVTTRTTATGYAEIRRFNQDRAVTISGENDPDVIQLDKIARLVEREFAEISAKYPGYSLDFGGEWNEFKNAFGSLAQLFVVGILLIYMILGAQFKSFLQPLIIIFTIPFAILGAVTGLLFLGAPFSIATMYGIVALAGVAVNDALVLVDFVNKGRLRGSGRYLSLIKAGKRRLRPILSTTITTIFGLLPMAIGIGGKSVVWGPLATTIVWGLSVATILTLFVIPALYAITDDIKSSLGLRLWSKPHEI